MRSMEFSGNSVDEAIFNGLNEMGVTIDEVEIETIQSESKGLFGIGAKPAVIRLTEREVPLVMEMEQVYRKEKEASFHQRRDQMPRNHAPRPERRDNTERYDRPDRRSAPHGEYNRGQRGGHAIMRPNPLWKSITTTRKNWQNRRHAPPF